MNGFQNGCGDGGLLSFNSARVDVIMALGLDA